MLENSFLFSQWKLGIFSSTLHMKTVYFYLKTVSREEKMSVLMLTYCKCVKKRRIITMVLFQRGDKKRFINFLRMTMRNDNNHMISIKNERLCDYNIIAITLI